MHAFAKSRKYNGRAKLVGPIMLGRGGVWTGPAVGVTARRRPGVPGWQRPITNRSLACAVNCGKQ